MKLILENWRNYLAEAQEERAIKLLNQLRYQDASTSPLDERETIYEQKNTSI